MAALLIKKNLSSDCLTFSTGIGCHNFTPSAEQNQNTSSGVYKGNNNNNHNKNNNNNYRGYSCLP